MDRGNPWLRWLDSTLGPPLLLLFRIFRTRRRAPTDLPRRIGLIKPAALGDTVLASAVAEDLRRAYPQAHIVLFCGAGNAGLAKLMTCFDEVIALPLRNPWSAFRKLRAQKVDWIIDLDSWPRISALWAAISGSGWSLGFQTAGQNRHFAFDQLVGHRSDLHEIENYRDLLRALKVPTGSSPHSFPGLPAPQKNPFLVVFHLWPGGTQSQLKEWPNRHWTVLLEHLLRRDPRLEIVFTGGKEDQSRTAEFLRSLPRDLCSDSGETKERVRSAAGCSLRETVVLLKSCGMVVSVNTGLLHMADAVGAPVVGLHGPTNPLRWGAVGAGQVSLVAKNPRAAQLNLGFEYDGGPSVMGDLNPQEVIEAVVQLAKTRSLGW